MQPNRRPVNSLSLSGNLGLSQSSGPYTPAGTRVTTPARASSLHNFNATTSPTRRPVASRNASDGVAAVLGGSNGTGNGITSPTRPNTRGRYDQLPGAGGAQLARTASSHGGRPVGSPQSPADALNFSTPAFASTTLTSSGKTSNRAIVLACGTGWTQGPRPTMEDAHFSMINVKEIEGQQVSIFGILDGHCGRRVADLGAQFFPEFFLSHPDAAKNPPLALVDSGIRTDHRVFQQIHRQDGGSTLIVATVVGKTLHVACIGDARAVLSEAGRAVAMSIDHKPTDPPEQQRVARCGGMVHFGRVGGCLAVSRALGDFEFKFNGLKYIHKEYQVSNVADIRSIALNDASQFLIIACDGLWDVMTNEDAVSWVTDYIGRAVETNKAPAIDRSKVLNACSQALAEAAVARGSMDNVSVTIVAFHEWIRQ
jgi:serine/threonine protein phosphatase PrpC